MTSSKFSWNDFDKAINELENKIRKSGIKFDWIVSINRGGLIAGVCLSHKLDIKHGVLSINNYNGKKKLANIKRDVSISMVDYGNFRGNVLIVDEIATSGETILEAMKLIKKDADIKVVKVATIHYQSDSKSIPDFYVKEVDPEIWITYPWEKDE